MAASAAEQATYIHGAQHHEVTSDNPEYQKIKLELENAGLTLKRLVKLTNTVLTDKFQTEADYLERVKATGKCLVSCFECFHVCYMFAHMCTMPPKVALLIVSLLCCSNLH